MVLGILLLAFCCTDKTKHFSVTISDTIRVSQIYAKVNVYLTGFNIRPINTFLAGSLKFIRPVTYF